MRKKYISVPLDITDSSIVIQFFNDLVNEIYVLQDEVFDLESAVEELENKLED